MYSVMVLYSIGLHLLVSFRAGAGPDHGYDRSRVQAWARAKHACVSTLQGLTSLRVMDLQGNQLSRLEDLNILRKHVCGLTHLDLRGNPLSRAASYQPLTLRRLPHLATLDGRALAGGDWESAAASHGLLTIPLLEECSSTRLLSIWSSVPGECEIAPLDSGFPAFFTLPVLS